MTLICDVCRRYVYSTLEFWHFILFFFFKLYNANFCVPHFPNRNLFCSKKGAAALETYFTVSVTWNCLFCFPICFWNEVNSCQLHLSSILAILCRTFTILWQSSATACKVNIKSCSTLVRILKRISAFSLFAVKPYMTGIRSFNFIFSHSLFTI